MASATSFRLDQRVSISGKGLGTIAFIGKTEFAEGDWIGIILDEPNGKNDGSVQKKDKTVRYFTCADNHGLYVKPGQIESVVNDSQSNLPRSGSNPSIKSHTNTPNKPSGVQTRQTGLRAPTTNTSNRSSGLTRSPQSSNELNSSSTSKEKTPVLPPPPPPPPGSKEDVKEAPPVSPIVESNETIRKPLSPTADSTQILLFKSKISDQEEQIETLKRKRRDDLEKLREFDRLKLQIDQFQSDKRVAQARIKELNDKNQQLENESKELKERFDSYRDEMTDTEIRIESLTLDLEMAEEKLEILTTENASLKEKLEETQLELDVIKGEIQLNGPNQVANSIQKKIDDERIIKLEQALIQLRDVSVARKNENEKLKEESKTLEHNIKILTKENENAKHEIATMQTAITDLKEQVDTCLGGQEMVDILTTKNLSLEDQVRDLQETVDNLESICDMDKEMEEHAKEIERELRENLDLLQNQIQEKERQIEQLQYTIGDHERTILKFRETHKTMQYQNEQIQKQLEKYDEQLKLVGSVQSSEFKAKIVETKSYAEKLDYQLKKFDVSYYTRYIHLIILFLPEQFLKRGADHDCLLVYLLIPRLISKCDLLIDEIQKQTNKIERITFDDIVKSHRAEQWSFTCKISQILSIFRMICRKYQQALEVCKPETLRQLANSYHDLLTHEKSLDILIEFLQKDQLHNSISLNSLDKTIVFFEHIYKIHFHDETFSMTNYLRDFLCVVSLSHDALQTDIQRIEILQKELGQAGSDQTPFANLLQRLVQGNEQMQAHIGKINRLVPIENESDRSIVLDSESISSIELTLKNLDRLAKTFHEICTGLNTQILLLSDANERISTQDIESIAYQACDKVYKKEDSGPYESLWSSMYDILSTLTNLSQSLENGQFDSTKPIEKSKQAIYRLAEQMKRSLSELDSFRARLEIKDDELLEMKKIFKLKQDEFAELNIRLSLNEKKIENLQKDLDNKVVKHQQIIEEIRIHFEKQLKQREDEVNELQNDIEVLQRERNEYKDRLKQLTRTKLVDDLIPKKSGVAQKIADVLNPIVDSGASSSQRQQTNQIVVTSPANDQEIASLRNTIRLLKDEIWQLKMNLSSNELTKLVIPKKDDKSNEIAQIYQNSTLLLNDLYSTIANYKITGENVQVKQELIRSKMKLVDQTAANLNNRLHQYQNSILPGSAIQTTMKSYLNPQFSKSSRQLAAEIHCPGMATGGEYDVTPEQYRLIMRETTGCI